MTFYELGSEKVENEMNVDKILKQLNITKYLMNNEKNKKLLRSKGPSVSLIDIDRYIEKDGEVSHETSLDYCYNFRGQMPQIILSDDSNDEIEERKVKRKKGNKNRHVRKSERDERSLINSFGDSRQNIRDDEQSRFEQSQNSGINNSRSHSQVSEFRYNSRNSIPLRTKDGPITDSYDEIANDS